MFGGGKGMGGGGGGGMLRVVGRTVTRAGVTNLQEPISSSAATASASSSTSATSPSRHTHKPGSCNNGNIILSSGSGSPFSAYNNLPVSANYGGGSTSPCRPPFGGSSCDDYEWVSVDGSDDDKGFEIGDDFVIGPVPSSDEVHSAVSALKQVFDSATYSQLIRDKFICEADQDLSYPISSPSSFSHPVSLSGTELDWMEPTLTPYNPRMLQIGSNRVYDAFHLLQNDPTVQKMVISLSSDKAVWDAVLNNEVVRELRETYQADENDTPQTPETSDEIVDNSNPALNFIKWIFDNTRAKVVEVFEKISKLVNELFNPSDGGKGTAGSKDPFEEKLRTSFLLSVVVLLVVVVTRTSSQKA